MTPPNDSKTSEARRVFSVAPEGITSIERGETLPPANSPDEVIFLTHILSLKTAALIHLGLIDEAGEEVDLETALQIIDTLVVLERRTQGNLSYEEQSLLEASVKELKHHYLKVSAREQ